MICRDREQKIPSIAGHKITGARDGDDHRYRADKPLSNCLEAFRAIRKSCQRECGDTRESDHKGEDKQCEAVNNKAVYRIVRQVPVWMAKGEEG